MLQANEIYEGAPVCVLREGKPFCNTTIEKVRRAQPRMMQDLDGQPKTVSEPILFLNGVTDGFNDMIPVYLSEVIPFHTAWKEVKFKAGVTE